MNDIIRAMEERRSIRKFKPDMPSKEDLEQIPGFAEGSWDRR